MSATISVIIICKNEEINITDCIKSAYFADEILVLDSGSTDNTVQLAKAAGAKVIETDWPGYGRQKNRAIEASSSDWIFSLDADERITPALATEILSKINHPEFNVYEVPRKSLYISRFMKHSGWYPDKTKRLFKRGSAKFTDSLIHESVTTAENTGALSEAILHFSYRDFESLLQKINLYSSIGAQKKFSESKKGSSLKRAVFSGIWAFFRTYIIKAGFLDGRAGFMLAVSNAEGVYYRHLKIMLLHQQHAKENSQPRS